jgi:hypothetical protein
MDTVASFSSPRPAEAIAAPSSRNDTSCERRSRAKRLTFVNRSTRLGKRIDELKALFESAFSAGELTPMRLERLAEAAQLKAMAEHERGLWMRGEARCDLDELVRLERKADQVVKALDIREAKPREASLLGRLAEGAR